MTALIKWQNVEFDANRMHIWQPPHVERSIELFIREAEALQRATQVAWDEKGGWWPDTAQLELALIALTSMGLRLNPTAKECCLLSFWKKGTRGTENKSHDVIPYVMRDGYRRLAADVWPIIYDDVTTVVEGDTFGAHKDETGLKWRWEPGEDRHRRALTDAMGALNNAPLIAGVGFIKFARSADRDPFSHVIWGDRLREKLKANRNVSDGRTPWATSFLAMLEKTIMIETYRHLPLRGSPRAAMDLAEMAEPVTIRSQLTAMSHDRQLPAECSDELAALDIEPPPTVPDTFEFQESPQ